MKKCSCKIKHRNHFGIFIFRLGLAPDVYETWKHPWLKEWTHQKLISQTHVFAFTIGLFQSLASDVSGGGKWNHVTALGRWMSTSRSETL